MRNKIILVCLLSSLFAHGALGAAVYWSIHREDALSIVANLDMSLSKFSPFSRAGGGGRRSEAWFLPPRGKKSHPLATPVREEKTPVPTVEEVKAADDGACHGDNCTGLGRGDGPATGSGDGGVIEAADASQKPRWIRNMITSADYPRLARQAGKDGLVVIEVLIDGEGRVRDARILQGAYEALNEVALRKVREAKFTPAYGADGRPVSCRVILPIRFELR